MPSVTTDPNSKVRLAATRLLLTLAPHMKDSAEQLQAALFKSQDKAKEVRRVGLLLLATLVMPPATEDGDEEAEERLPEELTRLPKLPAEQVTQLVRDALEPSRDKHAPLLRRLASAVLWRFLVSEHASDPATGLRELHVLEEEELFEPLLMEHIDELYAAQFGEIPAA